MMPTQEDSDAILARASCPKCGQEFTTDIAKFNDPGHTSCPNCGWDVALNEDMSGDTKIPNAFD
jgi:uncharacterized Zn finger protein (UPF0148 family)